MRNRGFSLIESLISLSFFLLVALSTLEFFGVTQTLFYKMKRAEEDTQAVIAALDKIKIDLQRAGFGLLQPLHLGIADGISCEDKNLIIRSRERVLFFAQNLVSGQTVIPLATTQDIKPGQDVCFFDSGKGEIKTVSSVQGSSLILSLPLEFSYEKDKSSLLLLEKVSLFLDERSGIIRRKVNASSPQPLLEEVLSFDFKFEREKNLAAVSFCLQHHKEKTHEILVYPKNTALALIR